MWWSDEEALLYIGQTCAFFRRTPTFLVAKMVCRTYLKENDKPPPSLGKIKQRILDMIKRLIKWFEDMTHQWEFIMGREVDFNVYLLNTAQNSGGVHMARFLANRDPNTMCKAWPRFEEMWYETLKQYKQFKHMQANLSDPPTLEQVQDLERTVRGVYDFMFNHHNNFRVLGERVNECINKELSANVEYKPNPTHNDFTECNDKNMYKKPHIKEWLSKGILWDDPNKHIWGSPQVYCNVPSPLKHLNGATLRRFLNNVLPQDLQGFGHRDLRAFVDGLPLNAGFSVSRWCDFVRRPSIGLLLTRNTVSGRQSRWWNCVRWKKEW